MGTSDLKRYKTDNAVGDENLWKKNPALKRREWKS